MSAAAVAQRPSPPSSSTAAAVDQAASYPSAKSVDIDMYRRFKELQKQLEQLDIQEEYIKYETKNLKREMVRAREEIQRVRSVPLVIGQFSEIIDAEHGIIQSSQGSSDYVRILSTINREDLKPGCSVALHRHSHAVVEILPPEADSTVQSAAMTEKPDVTYADIGGLDIQKQEIREAVELPLVQKDLYAQIGIDPPSGVLLYGPPGTGKTMLAKAVANHTTATFIRMVGSEFVQKYLGEGPRMVRDVFRLAREQAPSIVFIDEIDSIATKRFDAQTGADREVQRILLELLNQMDGFDQDTTVKVIMATNRADTLDPALLRPGRLDRKIEFPLPDRRQRRLIFQTITGKMNLSEDVDLEDFVSRPEKISAADIAAICQEAGMQAVRRNRYVVTQKDFEKGKREMREVTLVDPLSPTRPHEGEEEGSAKKVRFNNHVRVKLMDSDASRVEKLGSVLGDPKKEVLTRGWLTAAVESVVGGGDATALYGPESHSDMIQH
ncbi:26S proteasome regulatory subunit 6B [Perkinsus chesapeaki]|uniref:26S proteasome regulatory subunit 6B n=1 Tax=Perkinsus chesapeaki TaxID=330153 RepID=A0A7J6LT73_PERCH|nr:26S proteasome regulatory subunit 6B [Perkinsus chesapeaki]